jgi:hypothetical protein
MVAKLRFTHTSPLKRFRDALSKPAWVFPLEHQPDARNPKLVGQLHALACKYRKDNSCTFYFLKMIVEQICQVYSSRNQF